MSNCDKCNKTVKEGEEYNRNTKVLCEDCCVELRMTRTRKTHWLYLRSIKTEYLQPANKKWN